MKPPQTMASGQPDKSQNSPTEPRRDRRRTWAPPVLHRIEIDTYTEAALGTGPDGGTASVS